MTKLKTFKDLEYDCDCCFEEELKAEAIRHIKERRKQIKKDIKRIGDYGEVTDWDKGAIAGLMTFLDIEEEDIEASKDEN